MLRSDRRRPGHRLAQAPAEQVAHVDVEGLLGTLERRLQLGGDLLSAKLRLAHRDPHTRCLLELSSVAGARGQRMDLLEDPRHGRKERRLELHQVGHDLLRVLLPVSDRGADIEHQELNDQREGVRQRQEQVHALVHAHDVLRLQRRGNSAVVAVRKLTGLRRPGRPRRVDEQARGVRRDAVDALLKLGLRPPSPPLAQHLEREHAAIGVRGLHHDHELQRRQVRLDGADLRQLLCVLDEHRPRPGVMQHVMALLRRVRLVDRRDNRAGGKRRKTGVGPLRPRVRQDRNPVSRLDPQVDEPKRQLRSPCGRAARRRPRPTHHQACA